MNKVEKLSRTTGSKQVAFVSELIQEVNYNSLANLLDECPLSELEVQTERLKRTFKCEDITNKWNLKVISKAVRCLVPKNVNLSDGELLKYRSHNVYLNDTEISYQSTNSGPFVSVKYTSIDDAVKDWERYIGVDIHRYE